MNKKQPSAAGKKILNPDLFTILLVIALFFNFFIRLRLSDMPLERDEGEFGYIAQEILRGESPFSIYNFKIPGVSYVYALFMLFFGQTVTAIRMSLICFNLITIIFLYLLTKKLFSPLTAALAVLAYSVMSIHYGALGNSAHATHYMNTGIIGGLYFFIRAYESRKWVHYFIAGLLTGLAFIMKQPTAYFIPMLYIFMLYKFFTEKETLKTLIKNGLILTAGILLPFLIIVLLTLSFNDLESFWLWNFFYPRKAYADARDLEKGIKVFRDVFPYVTRQFVHYWLIGAAGIILALAGKIKNEKKWFLALFTIFSMPMVIAGLYFRNHYFINYLPVISVGIGLSFDIIKNKLFKKKQSQYQGAILMTVIFLIITIPVLSNERDFYFNQKPEKLSREIYGANPFIESRNISRYIRADADKDDKIAVIGSEAEVLYYTRLRSATGYLFIYPLVENQPYNKTMQQQFISEVEEAMPEYLIYFNIRTSWMADDNCPKEIFQWRNKFTTEEYGIIGIVEIYNKTSVYKWDKEVFGYQPRSSHYILIFKRIDLLTRER